MRRVAGGPVLGGEAGGIANKAGRYVKPVWRDPAGAALADGTLRFQSLLICETVTLIALGLRVTAATAATNIRMGIWSSRSNRPRDLILDLGSGNRLDASTTGNKESSAIALTLGPGRYWCGVVPQGGSPGILGNFAAETVTWIPFDTQPEALDATLSAWNYATASVPGALPASITAADLTGNYQEFRVSYRV